MATDAAKLLLIEDDPFLQDWIGTLREEHFPNVEVVQISSEREFLLRKSELARTGFKGIILDLMLPWEDGVDMDAKEFADPRGEYFEAGIRILEDIAQTPGLAESSILIHTVNDRNAVELPRVNKLATSFLRKDEPDHQLIRWINRHVF